MLKHWLTIFFSGFVLFTTAQDLINVDSLYSNMEMEEVFVEIDSSIYFEAIEKRRQDSMRALLTVEKLELNREERLLELKINKYRKAKKLPPLPVSKSLSYVARLHCMDLTDNDRKLKKGTNIHSWSPYGPWEAVDVYPDQTNQEGMWKKPAELTEYAGHGYEIAFGSAEKDYAISSEAAFQGWKRSKDHNALLLNKEKWQDIEWKAMGIGVYGKYACVWFGPEEDPAGVFELQQ